MPPLSAKFMEWNVKYVVFDSPTKAQVYYKDNTVTFYVWDERNKKWTISLPKPKSNLQT